MKLEKVIPIATSHPPYYPVSKEKGHNIMLKTQSWSWVWTVTQLGAPFSLWESIICSPSPVFQVGSGQAGPRDVGEGWHQETKKSGDVQGRNKRKLWFGSEPLPSVGCLGCTTLCKGLAAQPMCIVIKNAGLHGLPCETGSSDTSTSPLLLSEGSSQFPLLFLSFIVCKYVRILVSALNATWKAREHDVLFSPVHLTLLLQVSRIAYTEPEQVF